MDPGPALTQGFFIEKSRIESFAERKKGLQPHLFSEYVSAPLSRSSTRSFLRIIAEIPEEEILVFCKIYRPAFRNAAGVIPTFLRNFSMK